MGFEMSGASQSDTTPDFLRTAVEYRDRLKAELAKVDEFLRTADKRKGSGRPEYPEFLLTGNDELLDALLPEGFGSHSVH